MIREISGRELVPKKAAAANEKVKEAQDIMLKIVEAYKSQNNNNAPPLLSPGSVDGIWGDLTNTSYKNILSTFKKDNPPPANIDAAIGKLNDILISLNTTTEANQERGKENNTSAATPAKPEKADDAKAEAGFKNLLDLLQSKRLNLSAGGNKDVFKQRIERDWMAIIRAYGSTDSVAETFYPHLGLTDPEKILLAVVDAKTTFDTKYSSVLAKINNKFLETISKYIKPIGRAFRTERGMARVIDRRQKREEKRSNSLEKLNILSKVAARKDVARARLEKTAILPSPLILAPAILALYGTAAAATYAFEEINKYLNQEFVTKEEFNKAIGDLRFNQIIGMSLIDWVNKNESAANQVLFITGTKYNYLPATKAYNAKLTKLNQEEILSPQSTARRPPDKTRRAPVTDPTARIRTLLVTSLHDPGNGKGWDTELNNAFLEAYDEWSAFKTFESETNLPEITGGWKAVAPQIGFQPSISGAEALVTELISLKNSQGGQASDLEPAAPAAAPGQTPVDNTNRAKTKLTELFEKILSGSTKVDRVGIDLRNDTKIFKGVITGLGGASQAVEYVFSKVKFTEIQLVELAGMNFDSNQKITINALALVRNLFVNIRKVSTDGIGRDRRGLTEDSLARSVTRWLGEQTATPAATQAKASIRKSIEIRKMAARKKLGF